MRGTRDIKNGLRLAKQNWSICFATSLIMAICCAVINIALGDVIVQYRVIKAGSELRERNSMAFVARYALKDSTSVTPYNIRILENMINRGRGYTTVINNVGVDTAAVGQGPENVVVVANSGVASGALGVQLCPTAPCAMVGYQTTDPEISESLLRSVSQKNIPTSRLPRGSILYDPNAGAIELDRKVLVRLPSSSLSRMTKLEREEAMLRAVLLNPTGYETNKLLGASVRSGLYPVPISLKDGDAIRFDRMMQEASVYVIGMGSFIALLVFVFRSVAHEALKRKLRYFRLSQWYGASRRSIVLQVGTFLACSMLLFPLIILSVLFAIGGPSRLGATVMIPLLVSIYTLLLSGSVRAVERNGGWIR